jgi:hypothetical protein
MKGRRATNLLLSIATKLAMLLVFSSSAFAQCALCKNAVTGSPSAAKLSESLNFAIIILLIPPVLIFCGIFYVAYRHRQARGTKDESLPVDEKPGRDGFAKSSARQRKRKSKQEHETGGALA